MYKEKPSVRLFDLAEIQVNHNGMLISTTTSESRWNAILKYLDEEYEKSNQPTMD